MSKTPGDDNKAAIEKLVQSIVTDRAPGQVASIASQLEELFEMARREGLGFEEESPIGIGISGGRFRVAFMHPDMRRFCGPGWQMPIGAANGAGREQIVTLIQSSKDGRIHLTPAAKKHRETVPCVDVKQLDMYPGEDINDLYSYERFGTAMTKHLLTYLGYATDDDLDALRRSGRPIPATSRWVSNSMRRPFSLVANAIASVRTVRKETVGKRVQAQLGKNGFQGMKVLLTGSVPQGGFASSSAVTVAVLNALNALYDLEIDADLLVHLACQAEYGTGVRAGALDHATEQKGRFQKGSLISSNPRDNYRVLGTYPVPAERFRMLFAFSVDRDTEAWKWSAGTYVNASEPGRLTTLEARKMTGKAAEIAAILARLPLDVDFFGLVEEDLLQNGTLGLSTCRQVYARLGKLPLFATQDDLRGMLDANLAWYANQLTKLEGPNPASGMDRTAAVFGSLLEGWADAKFTRTIASGDMVEDEGIPLRAIVAYLFGEVAKNFYLIHNSNQWIEYVTRSQRGDKWFDIHPAELPNKKEMMGELAWEKPFAGPQLMEEWLKRCDAAPFDFNRGLDDDSCSADNPVPLHHIEGTNFFRGLALIDLAEAMLKRTFGAPNIAVRVNAAGQGDFFQVHVDTNEVDVAEVKQFIRISFHRRFGLRPSRDFVEPHPGGRAVGGQLNRFRDVAVLVRELRACS